MTLSVSYFDFDSLKMPGVIEEFYSAKEAMDAAENEMSLSRLTLSNDNEEKGEYGDFFPFATLPDELIGHTFSFLPIKDRLRSRVNRRLNKIELQSKYHVDKLAIVSWDFYANPILDGQIIEMPEGRTLDCLRRITQNSSIGFLKIDLCCSAIFYREVYNIIKDFDIGTLKIELANEYLKYEILVDSFFLDLARSFKELVLYYSSDNITLHALHQVYKMMMERSIKLRKMDTCITNTEQVPFLGLIGITFRDGRFFSERDIEAVDMVMSSVHGVEMRRTSIFDGSLEISFILHKLTYLVGNDEYSFGYLFSLELHESEESLENAKNKDGYAKVNIVPR